MELLESLCDPMGVLLRRDAVACGISDKALRRLVLGKRLVRLRQGAYALRDRYLAADTLTRHLMLARAVMRQYADHVVLSHVSACLIQGGPLWGFDLADVHLTHLEGGGRQNSRIRHHQGELRVGDVRRIHGHWVTVPARAVMETATITGVEPAFVQANHFLRTGEATSEELAEHYARQVNWPGSLAHHPILLLADGRLETVGESRTAYLLWIHGLLGWVPQLEVFDPDGELVGRVDFAWPKLRVIVEFDGLAKYHRYRRPGESVAEMIDRERKREARLRELGWVVVRITWADLDLPQATANRIRHAMALAARLGLQQLGA